MVFKKTHHAQLVLVLLDKHLSEVGLKEYRNDIPGLVLDDLVRRDVPVRVIRYGFTILATALLAVAVVLRMDHFKEITHHGEQTAGKQFVPRFILHKQFVSSRASALVTAGAVALRETSINEELALVFHLPIVISVVGEFLDRGLCDFQSLALYQREAE